MKRPIVLIPIVALIAVIAVVAVALAGGNSDNNNGTAAISIANHGLGKMLVDSQGRTLYLWQADTGMSSTCSGACAQGWPPVTTSGTPKAAGGVQAGWLGTTKRADGTLQVTYGGHPLYRFAGDTAAGQVNGQANDGFGAPWYVVAGDGSAITKTA